MRVLVNARFLLPGQLEGLGRFSDEVLKRLVAAHPEVDFHFVFDRPYDQRFIYAKNVTPHVLTPPARHPLLFVLWFEYLLPPLIKKLQPDVFFSPDGYLSLRSQRCPQVPVFHDLAFLRFSEAVGRAAKWHYFRYFPRYAQRAALILTVSEYSKQDILAKYGTEEHKVKVVGNGASGAFEPLNDEEQAKVRAQYSDGQPYFLYVGALQPRKNIANLLAAFDQFKTATGAPHQLLLTGRKAWKTSSIENAYERMTHQSAVRLTGYLEDADLRKVYGAAYALTYVSLFEGFGLPVLEAMHAETAVITSTTSSMPEVAGDAALLVDPHNTAEIAGAMQQLAEDDQLREGLIAKGRLQRERFSWEQTAERVWEALDWVTLKR